MKGEGADIVVGMMMVPLGLLGLLLAARALDLEIEVFGWSLSAFAMLFGFGVLKRQCDRTDTERALARAETRQAVSHG
jgi:hypothetical protein